MNSNLRNLLRCLDLDVPVTVRSTQNISVDYIYLLIFKKNLYFLENPFYCGYALVFFFFTFDVIGAGVLNTVLKENTQWYF